MIALYAYPIDIHSPTEGTTEFDGKYHAANIYQLPYRILIPVEMDGLLVAGRCVSATHEAHAAIRVMPCTFALGQAAGVAAALSCQAGVEPRAVELAFLTLTEVPSEARWETWVEHCARSLQALGPKVVVVTLGAQGALWMAENRLSVRVAGFSVAEVDTLGAGDCFFGVLTCLLAERDIPPALLSEGEARNLIETANAAAALSTTRRGGMASFPTRSEVIEFLNVQQHRALHST
ncbi:MAG: PfkB family carbohydrate kinase [Firmicutes bacterium]|nr:PfkB family carbohydrate kinase [Bacillota bacterium]